MAWKATSGDVYCMCWPCPSSPTAAYACWTEAFKQVLQGFCISCLSCKTKSSIMTLDGGNRPAM